PGLPRAAAPPPVGTGQFRNPLPHLAPFASVLVVSIYSAPGRAVVLRGPAAHVRRTGRWSGPGAYPNGHAAGRVPPKTAAPAGQGMEIGSRHAVPALLPTE